MNPERQEVTVSLQDLVTFLLRGAVLAILLAGLAGTAAYVLTSRQPAAYRAEATLLVARSTGGASQFGISPVMAPPIELNAYRVVVESDSVLSEALRRLGVAEPTLDDVRRLRGLVGSTAETGARDSSLLRLEGIGATPTLAVDRANALAAAIVAWDRRRASESIDRVIATLTQQIEALSEQIRALQAVGDSTAQSQVDGLVRLRAEQQQQLAYARALVASAEGMLSILQPADSTIRQIAPRPLVGTAVAILLAVVAAYGWMLVRAAFNTRLRGSEDIGGATGLEVIAEFPTVARDESNRLREASSYLRTSLLFATEEARRRVFMVTSAVDGEGKTTVARALAEGFARNGYRTLLVDADLRSPSVVEAYQVEGPVSDRATTESWLSDPEGQHQLLTVALGDEGQLDVIPQYRRISNAPEMLGRGFSAALSRWNQYDVVVVDTPPVLAVADPLTVALHCTGTVFVVDRQRSDRRKLTSAVAALQRLGVRLLGVVANNVGPVSGGVGYGTTYGEQAPRRRRTPTEPKAVGRLSGADEPS